MSEPSLLEDLKNLVEAYENNEITYKKVVKTLKGIVQFEEMLINKTYPPSQVQKIIRSFEKEEEREKKKLENRREYMRKYIAKKRKEDPEYAKKQREVAKKYYYENKEKVAQYQKETRTNEYSRDYMKKRRKDPFWRITDALRARVYTAMKRKKGVKSKTTLSLLGVKNFQEVINHLVCQFKEGMTLDNYGEWHIDHIIPCSAFNLLDVAEQKKCFHYTNLQPLWAKENISKGNKIDV